jgi:cullin-associated NEDD8-dissociated protein 1
MQDSFFILICRRVTTSILRVGFTAKDSVIQSVMEPVLLLSTSSLLQDPALASLLSLVKEMIISDAIGFQELHDYLLTKLTSETGRHGLQNLAKCVATIAASTSIENKQKVLQSILTSLDGSKTPSDTVEVAKVQMSLLVTGDLGRMIDLLKINESASQLKDIYVSYFDSNSEELKNAAAYALGNAAVGSPETFLQSMVNELDKGNKNHAYLLLSALREFIVHRSDNGEDFAGMSTSLLAIIPALERYCSDNEEGVRTMVSECLGALTCQQPDIMLPKLEQWLKACSTNDVGDNASKVEESALVSWTVVSAVKVAIAGKVDASLLAVSMPSFITLVQHKDVHVRHASLLMIYSAVHHMPRAISPLMRDDIMSSLYELAKLKLERKVDLGPFTHTVDDALPLRKAALSIFSTCMDNIPESVDVSEFILVLVKALGDAEDIQLHAHQILIGMCNHQPAYILAALDSFVDPLEKTMNKKSGDKSGTELDRLNDWIKSALRVMVAMSKLEGSLNSRKFSEFSDRIKCNTKFTGLLSGIEN